MNKFTKSIFKFIGVTVLLLIFFLLLSVSPPLRNVKSVSKLYGSYIATYEFAQVKLTINKDETYTQEVTLIPSSKVYRTGLTINKNGTSTQGTTVISSSRVDTAKGTWSYDPEDDYFIFDHNFMSIVDGFGDFKPNYAQPHTGLSELCAYRWFFHIYLDGGETTKYKKND
jgi:hypothetical protein